MPSHTWTVHNQGGVNSPAQCNNGFHIHAPKSVIDLLYQSLLQTILLACVNNNCLQNRIAWTSVLFLIEKSRFVNQLLLYFLMEDTKVCGARNSFQYHVKAINPAIGGILTSVQWHKHHKTAKPSLCMWVQELTLHHFFVMIVGQGGREYIPK